MNDTHPSPPAYSGSLDSGSTPAVVVWFRVYAGLMALMYLVVAGAGIALIVMAPATFGAEASSEDALTMKLMGWIYGGVGVVFLIPFVIGVFMGRASWCWVYGIVMICISLTSICCLPAGIPLLIYWLKPEAKRYFGRQA